ncbi:uncharacterized protein LOC143300329 [Babylonia areolata]|uniref:uncharacterized protein LOC143300329 n=1 Tax=Babylonia areolata TaxID=304850 RepID=UPI003FD68AF9
MGEMIMDEPKSAIKHEGTYFIMDSEQLVCNPFHDLQSEAISEVQKRAQLSEKRTEKVTTVKNNVCDNHFFMERAQLEREKSRSMKILHDKSSKLRYEVKLLDLDRQKHRIEMKKRVMPERDYSYEEGQISNTEKRLGANIASFYLERRMKFPMRLKSVSDISTTPLVQKARQVLKLQEISTAPKAGRGDRAQTAKSLSSSTAASSSGDAPARPVQFRRRGSRSAPLVSRSYGGQAARDDTRLPAITDLHEPRNNKSGHVQFMFEDPLKILTSEDPLKILMTKDKDMDDSASLLSRPYTYHPGMGHDRDRLNSQDFFLDASDDEDDAYLPDHIDLRALLFDREGRREEIICMKSTGQGNTVPSAILRRSNAYAPKKTQDLMQQENEKVQSKVDRFLQEMHGQHEDSGSDEEEERGMFTALPRASRAPVQVPAIHHTKPSITTDDGDDTNTQQSSAEEEEARRRGHHHDDRRTPKIPRDAWKYIRGRSTDGSLRGTYSPEDIVLHTMTGVPLTRALTAGIPLHSAGRAMRHTATFRMRKVVQRLINERTKYQQHEIEELKRKMEQGMDLAQAAASLAPGPNAAIPGRDPPRNRSRMDSTRPLSQGVLG